MEAIIRHSGRQFKVKAGGTLKIDYREVEPGSTMEFTEVLYIGEEGAAPRIGKPTLPGAKVLGKVVGSLRGPKLIAVRFRRRKNTRRRVGHRQKFTQVQIESIQG
jgi:large subunit ribosomal protein L21